MPAGRLVEIAGWSDVFDVEPWVAPHLHDEVLAIRASGLVRPLAERSRKVATLVSSVMEGAGSPATDSSAFFTRLSTTCVSFSASPWSGGSEGS